MSVIKLKSSDERIFEVDIEVMIANAESILINKKFDTSNKCLFSRVLNFNWQVAKKSVTIKELLENVTTEGDVSICLFLHIFEFFFFPTFPH